MVWKIGRAQLAGAATAASALLMAAGANAACPPPPAGKLAVEPLEIVTRDGVRRFSVEIANTDASREYGLMCRTSLAANRGMLFQFDRPDVQSFWMKNTLIPLDIIYIGADGRIDSIAHDARPMDETPLSSNGPATGVLEIEGGLAAKLGIKAGDRVVHPFFKDR